VASKVPPEKLQLLKSLHAIPYGGFDDSDEDINDMIKSLTGLNKLNFKGTVSYDCLETFYTHPNGIKYVALPWPQKDYSEMKKKFVSKTVGLEGLQLQSRDDELLILLAKHHGKTIKELHLACTEAVTTEAIAKTIRTMPQLTYLSLYFYDGHLLTNELLDTIRQLKNIKQMWLGSLSSAVVLEPLRIVHENLEELIMSELSVTYLEVDCPNIRKLIPPILILDPECARVLYERSYPGEFCGESDECGRRDDSFGEDYGSHSKGGVFD